MTAKKINGDKGKQLDMAKKPNQRAALAVDQFGDETAEQAVARTLLEPSARHGHSAAAFASKMMSGTDGMPSLMDYSDHVHAAGNRAAKGDLSDASRMLAAQAITLDNMFTELARRAALNMGDYINATESFGRLALKAQSNCRATLEALAKLHQPREQTVRHVHVNEGGQAVIADQVHNHAGVLGNEESIKQSLTTSGAGALAALPSPDPLGGGVPIPSRERAEAVPDARWHEPRSA